MTEAAMRRQTRQLLKAASATLAGRQRGPDFDPEGKRRVPRRDSYDIADNRAKPWRPIGDGSVAEGLAYRDALLQVARELFQKFWRDMPAREIREAKARHAGLAAELDAYTAGGTAPAGRPATVRQELAKLRVYLKAADRRLRRTDLAVLDALISGVDFASGRLFPALETIAATAACHKNTVVAALHRLKHHGLINWVRRTVRTGNEGEFAPQREQTSNAYYFDHRAEMQPRTWQRYWQLVVAKLRRIGAKRPPPDRPAAPLAPASQDLRDTLGRVGNLIDLRDNAST